MGSLRSMDFRGKVRLPHTTADVSYFIYMVFNLIGLRATLPGKN